MFVIVLWLNRITSPVNTFQFSLKKLKIIRSNVIPSGLINGFLHNYQAIMSHKHVQKYNFKNSTALIVCIDSPAFFGFSSTISREATARDEANVSTHRKTVSIYN